MTSWTFDPVAKAGYLGIRHGQVARTVCLDDEVNLDLDTEDRMIGVERIGGPINEATLIKALRAARFMGASQ